ncbi:MAG TPA: aspartate-alanine antiporter, partial [Alistipes putredinis]|nr:aspartate-alanine antiporter [Alistipes putredinis]
VGQLRIEIPEPAKTLFFLMFLFAVGYAVGPQFFRGLKKDGLPQVAFAVVVCLLCLGSVWLFSWLMGYTLSQAAGLLAGSQTMSAVLGVATDTIRELPGGAETDLSSMPVCYAVTYIFGTAGSAWVLSSIGPRLLGGVAKVKQSARDLEQKMGEDVSLKAGFDPAAREIVFRVFSADNEWFEGGRTVHEFETVMQRDGKRIFVERLCQQGKVVDEVTPRTVIRPGDQLVVSGRREYVISEEKWIGAEVSDTTLTNFAVQVLPVVVNRKGAAGERIGKVLSAKFMHGVNIRSIVRAGVKIPVRSGAKLDAGDRIELVGLPQDVRRAAAQLGFSDPVKTESSVPLLGLGICLGGLIFGWMLVAKIGAIPLSLTVSGGVLLAGLFCGWARSRRPTLGGIPEQTVWFMNNMGLNTFIAIVGISTGPSFVAGFQQVGWSLFLVGAGATTLPLVLGVLIGRYLFRFNDALTLGCVAGARTTTAALGAVEDTIGSNVPSLGYTITYAIGNTLLIIWGVVLVLLLA